ncbi:hypothetical protein vseg_003952 [Gypsophila vaccaria]
MDKEFFVNEVGLPVPSQLQYDHPFATTTWHSFVTPPQDYFLTTPPPPNDHFESALSSMVSSPVHTNSAISTDNLMIRELIGKLGSICNANDLPNYVNDGCYSTSNSCYSTPLNSPPKLGRGISSFGMTPNLPAMPGDPGFAERAARFSSFGSRSFNGRTTTTGNPNADIIVRPCSNLQRVLSSPSLKVDVGIGSRVGNDNDNDNDDEGGGICKSRENSSVAENGGASNRKRKAAVSKGKGKASESHSQMPANCNDNKSIVRPSEVGENGENSNKKRGRPDVSEENKRKEEKQKVNNEAPKDYIHVRARRGQATDSHSLAERVRREKISERMKLLQDLVPGCNRVTGKALMLDEIINYVQSLQRQVEFLSMKLSTVNPTLDFNMDNLLTKDMIQPNCTMTHPMYPTMVPTLYGQPHHNPLQESLTNLGTTSSCPMDPLNPTLNHTHALQLSSIDGLLPNCLPRQPALCEGDLRNIVDMRYGQNEGALFEAQTSHGTNPAQMKIEY